MYKLLTISLPTNLLNLLNHSTDHGDHVLKGTRYIKGFFMLYSASSTCHSKFKIHAQKTQGGKCVVSVCVFY